MGGERRGLAKAISYVENSPAHSRPLIAHLYHHQALGKALVVGITGPPGGGKSTLTSFLVKHLRATGATVGVILVDPSSPFTGGAFLGDRVRMAHSNSDPGVFIRSMGTRGHLGGLSLATQDTVLLMDAYGVDFVFIETVGIGQSETDIVRTADITIVITVPGLGDEIQVNKAGIMEIGDIFVVNKADLDGAERVVTEINVMLDMAPRLGNAPNLRPPVLRTVANRDRGVAELWATLQERLQQFAEIGELALRRERRLWQSVLGSVQFQIEQQLSPVLAQQRSGILSRIAEGSSSPFEEAKHILQIIERK